MTDSNFQWILVVVVGVIVAAGLGWWYLQPEPEPTDEAPPAAAQPAAAQDPALPAHPMPPPPPADTRRELVELPPLADSDGYFSLAVVDLLGPQIDELLVDSGVIEKVVATIDNLPRDRVAERIRPIGRLPGSFTVDALDDDSYVMSPDNADRYQFLVNRLTASDADTIYATYQRFYPLFQQAYVNLGYPDGYFNDRVVEVIDHLLETPAIEETPELVRPHVLYEYADPELEALSTGQKAMLRLGPAQQADVRRVLRELRSRIE